MTRPFAAGHRPCTIPTATFSMPASDLPTYPQTDCTPYRPQQLDPRSWPQTTSDSPPSRSLGNTSRSLQLPGARGHGRDRVPGEEVRPPAASKLRRHDAGVGLDIELLLRALDIAARRRPQILTCCEVLVFHSRGCGAHGESLPCACGGGG
ncbi:uncharacterized protein CC84DRAFT_598563 [Paraphaeosphaeria sporulosa]|uniref:Uncharacterized protein n=1 Tax=Paraphaeosphaeria sporulosa TaxID=1460663 RepID=A0A177CQD0_9PLEO|nr:uncharacterized protein CC84DRAFT_598563 [Paraphaeosphaeria sporulosa]OAG08957.1 hypothetical protein CC84DRAFT_598563 [Paraphaeosphaeria sporulosa]